MERMRTLDELDDAWAAAQPQPREAGTVRALCLRRARGHHEAPDRVEATIGGGLTGDRWADREAGTDPGGATAVTLMNATVAELVADGQPIQTAGDNVYVDLDIGVENLPPGTRLEIGDAILRISEQPHTGCTTFRDRFGLDALRWVSAPAGRAHRLRGVNCSVERAGTIRVGDPIAVIERGARVSADEDQTTAEVA
jgi:MOSC domain-containing protein YiiM